MNTNIDILDILLDQDNREPIVLVDEDGRTNYTDLAKGFSRINFKIRGLKWKNMTKSIYWTCF